MPRMARQRSGSGYYHILARGNNRQVIFHDCGDYRFYLESAAEYKRKWSWKLHHFCLMPNHVHLLVSAEEFRHLPKFMQGLSQCYEKYYRKRYSHSGHLWQGRYKSIPIEQESYLLECARYVERNPVRAKMVDEPNQYAWSSYRIYAEGLASDLVDLDRVYLSLGETSNARQEVYRTYLLVTRPYEQILDSSLKIGDVPQRDSLEIISKE